MLNNFFPFSYLCQMHRGTEEGSLAELRVIENTIQDPWSAIGDFNMVVSGDEKFGGRPHRMEVSLDFIE